ncbi:hypothetical protein [Burkholderia diffusa]|uniref:hypothetical protein n=1 Tax=Burkholderia diffusa TaxID=488732 RepID=UPI000AE82E6E|nr:hypothetical protein [Burkholderia diffusa]
MNTVALFEQGARLSPPRWACCVVWGGAASPVVTPIAAVSDGNTGLVAIGS